MDWFKALPTSCWSWGCLSCRSDSPLSSVPLWAPLGRTLQPPGHGNAHRLLPHHHPAQHRAGKPWGQGTSKGGGMAQGVHAARTLPGARYLQQCSKEQEHLQGFAQGPGGPVRASPQTGACTPWLTHHSSHTVPLGGQLLCNLLDSNIVLLSSACSAFLRSRSPSPGSSRSTNPCASLELISPASTSPTSLLAS